MRKTAWLVPIILLGCAPKNPYLGSWDSEIMVMDNRVPMVSTFAESKAYSATFEVAGVKGTLTGSYSYEQDRLTIKFDKVDLDTKESLLPKSLVDQGREAIEKEIESPKVGAVTWTTDTSFTVKPDQAGAPTITFTKKQS